MSLFHKRINELLELHIKNLEEIGLLDDDWYWNRQKMLRLKEVDAKLLNDLTTLYRKHMVSKEKYQELAEELLALREALAQLLNDTLRLPEERARYLRVNRFLREIRYLITKDLPLKIGVVGYITQKFDEEKARKLLKRIFDKINGKYPKRRKVVISMLVDLGVCSLAYREATRRRWKTVGIENQLVRTYKPFPVNEVVRAETAMHERFSFFTIPLDVVVRIGGSNLDRELCETSRKKDKDIFEVEVKAPSLIIKDIDPIAKSGISIKRKTQLSNVVERPLLKACRILYDKNIRIVMSSANLQNIGEGAHILIDYDSLSEENKRIGLRLGTLSPPAPVQQLKTVVPVKPCSTIRISIPISRGSTPVIEIEREAVKIANYFKHQKMTWVERYTYNQICLLIGWPASKRTPPNILAKMAGYYYSSREKLFYLSEEHYRKSHES